MKSIMTKKENLKNHLRDLNSNMTQVIDTKKYIEFVRETTSKASSDFPSLLSRLTELEVGDADVPRLMTAAFGVSAEAGELVEIIKKTLPKRGESVYFINPPLLYFHYDEYQKFLLDILLIVFGN